MAASSDSESVSELVEVIDYFPDISDDLSKVTWAHAVNSLIDLEAHIVDHKIMMLEADVSAGQLKGKNEGGKKIPIMAHPPDTESDLSLEMWIDLVIKANEKGLNKGVKLDFKDITIVESSLQLLKKRYDQIQFPLWLNADILRGPVDGGLAIDADKFLQQCINYFPQATLSVGWTSKYDPNGSYSMEMVKEMTEVLEKHEVGQPVTFPIRAAFVGSSLDALEWLIDHVPDSTITVWSFPTDEIDAVALVTLRNVLGHDMVFFDLPEDQQAAFDSAKKADSSTHSGIRFPETTTTIATVLVALASAFAALYYYD